MMFSLFNNNLNRLIIFFAWLVLFNTLSTLHAQDKENQPVFKSDVVTNTNQINTLSHKPINIQISIINPNDRDAQKLKMNEVTYTAFSENILKIQRHKVLNYWLKISTTTGDPLQSDHLLSFIPTAISKLDLYIPEISSTSPILSTHQYKINTHSKFSRRALVFEIPNEVKYTDAVYFRVESKRNANISLEYWSVDEYYRVDRKHNSFLSMIYASLFILIIINFIFYIGIRDKNYIFYIFFLLSLIPVLMTSSGKIFEFEAANLFSATENNVYLFKCLSIFLLVTFLQYFLRIKDFIPPIYKLTEGIRVIYAILIGLSFALRPLPGLIPEIIYWLSLLLSPLLLIIPLLLLQAGNRQARYILYALVPLIISLIIYEVFGLDSQSINPFYKYAVQTGIIAQAIIMSIALSDGVIDLSKQRDFAEHGSEQHSVSLEIEKKHSELISRVNMHAKYDPKLDPDKEMLRGFFHELKPLFKFHKAAIIYQIDSKLIIHTNKEKFQKQFEAYISSNLIDVTRICHGNNISELKVDESQHLKHNTKVIVVPVFMRGQEWSGLLLNVDNSQHYSSNDKDAMHRYATEMIRSLLTVHMVDSIREEVRQDPVTQKLNRGAIFDELEKAINETQYSEKPLSIGLIDIDNFKDLNDEQGKDVGDACLTYLATHLSKQLPDTTLIGRIAGDEFLTILPNTTADQTQSLFQDACDSMHTLNINNQEISLSVSIGITECMGSFETSRDMMKRADKSLHDSKRTGNNTITVALY